jgi:hypothetical protein
MSLGLAARDGNSKSSPVFDQGTVFLVPDLITASDPSSFVRLTVRGQGERNMFDRRLDGWKTYNAYLFEATYKDSAPIEVQVNPEFGSTAAAKEADKYARAFGQLPALLRARVKTSWIHKGTDLYGGGNDNILIHTGRTVEYEGLGVMEEALLHEATHTSLDPVHTKSGPWKAAQQRDGVYLSDYGAQHSEREDLAETYLIYLAVRYKADRLPEGYKERIEQSIPARLAFLDSRIDGALTPFAKRKTRG